MKHETAAPLLNPTAGTCGAVAEGFSIEADSASPLLKFLPCWPGKNCTSSASVQSCCEACSVVTGCGAFTANASGCSLRKDARGLVHAAAAELPGQPRPHGPTIYLLRNTDCKSDVPVPQPAYPKLILDIHAGLMSCQTCQSIEVRYSFLQRCKSSANNDLIGTFQEHL
jgi:hypothetical protein